MSDQPTILLVDDYPDALEVWQIYLSAFGFTVLTASNGHDAVDVAERVVPSLIVTDLELPGMSGFDIARHLRGQASTRHIPLIAATGYSHVAASDRTRAVGFDAVIIKPCPPDRLLNEIQRLLKTVGVTAPGHGQ